uniref:Uncharacterized protein n=1 Tax=Anguilla anguilla TaxID=7936 RepID=A0A0E9P6U6_ANGAN
MRHKQVTLQARHYIDLYDLTDKITQNAY